MKLFTSKNSRRDRTFTPFAVAVIVQLVICLHAFGQRDGFIEGHLSVAGQDVIFSRVELPAGQTPLQDGSLGPDVSKGDSQAIPVAVDRGNLSAPVRSLANAVLGSQSISTRMVLGSKMVRVRPQDEVWFVSARRDDGVLVCEKLVGGSWNSSGVGQLTMAHESDRQKSTVIYVHGNQTNDEYARARGLQLYQSLFNRNLCEPAARVRFVVFAWRSEREKARMTSDFKIKLKRSIRVGSIFRCFLDQFESRNMLLVGFSLGGQVILSGLQEEQLRLEQIPDCKRGKYSVALVTPALDPIRESTCLNAVDENNAVVQTVAFLNRKDPAIRASNALTRGRRSHVCEQSGDEITFSRLGEWCPGELFGTIRVEDITAEVSYCHSVTKYADQSATLRKNIAALIDMIHPADPTVGEMAAPAIALPQVLLPTAVPVVPMAPSG